MEHEGIRIPPPVWPGLALLAAWGLEAWRPTEAPVAWRAVGGAGSAAGLGLILWAVRVQGTAGTDPEPWRPTRALVTRGPYAWSRNPIYLGLLVLQAGLGAAIGWLWWTVLTPATWASLRWLVIAREERFLATRFASGYAAYRARVRRWLGVRAVGTGHTPSAAGGRKS